VAYIPRDHAIHEWRQRVARFAAEAVRRQGWQLAWSEGGVGIDVIYYMPRARSNKRKLPTIKPDLSNMNKAIEDSLTGIVWRDDSVVCESRERKVFAGSAESCGVVIDVWTLEDD
jgi:Holliday junction resolvase RusA-like endonuclease